MSRKESVTFNSTTSFVTEVLASAGIYFHLFICFVPICCI